MCPRCRCRRCRCRCERKREVSSARGVQLESTDGAGMSRVLFAAGRDDMWDSLSNCGGRRWYSEAGCVHPRAPARALCVAEGSGGMQQGINRTPYTHITIRERWPHNCWLLCAHCMRPLRTAPPACRARYGIPHRFFLPLLAPHVHLSSPTGRPQSSSRPLDHVQPTGPRRRPQSESRPPPCPNSALSGSAALHDLHSVAGHGSGCAAPVRGTSGGERPGGERSDRLPTSRISLRGPPSEAGWT